jgi:hypothetical protein
MRNERALGPLLLLLGVVALAPSACGSLELASGSGGAGSSSSTTTTTSGAGGAASSTTSSTGAGGDEPVEPRVFLILMENHNWGPIKGNPGAPFINGLLAKGAYAEHYYSPAGIHPSEPNYLWLEAGTNFGVLNDKDPAINHQATKEHLVTLLEGAGRSWRSYQEDISGLDCPLTATKKYAPRHNPVVFFDDVTEGGAVFAARCIAHVRPFHELDQDLVEGKVADYNFLTPNLCNDGHNLCTPQFDRLRQSDDWLSVQVPKLLASQAYARGAVVLITWDEGENNSDGPIGLIALGKGVKPGYSNQVPYTHSSTLRTVQTVLGVSPFLGDAAKATDLSDLFEHLP